MRWFLGVIGVVAAGALLFGAVGHLDEGAAYQCRPLPASLSVPASRFDILIGAVTCERYRVLLSADETTTTELFRTPDTVLSVVSAHPPGAESPQLLVLTAEETKAGRWWKSHLYLLSPDEPGQATTLSPEAHYNFWDLSTGDVDGDGREEVALCTYSCTARDSRYAQRFFVYSWNEEGDLYPRWRGSRLCRRYVSAQLADITGDEKAELVSVEVGLGGGEMLVAYEWNQFGFWGLGHTREYEEVKILEAPARTADGDKGVLVALTFPEGRQERAFMVVRDNMILSDVCGSPVKQGGIEMKRTVFVMCLAVVVVLSLGAGCGRKAVTPPEVIPGPVSKPSQEGRQARETGFSIELGEPPQFEAKVEPYEIAEGLSNVANLEQFKDDLRPEHIKAIAENGFVVVPAEWRQMEFVYELNNYEREHKPSVATADSMLHTFHIFYDYLLRTIEVSTLYERASTLAVGLLEGAQASYEEATEAEIKEAALYNFAFAAVPAALLEVEHEVAIPEEVAELVKAELALIEAHADFEMSPTVGFKVDYSQFVPRGHYTRSEKLKRYFKGMMWYGLMPVAMRNMRDELAPRQCRQAVLLAQIVLNARAGDEALTEVWEDVYEPTAFMVGFADDNTPDDFGEATSRLFGAPLETKKLLPEDNLERLAVEVLKMRPPGIVMASVTGDPTLPGIPQFRLMGQRFVLDSHIFQMMVFPHVGKGEAPPDSPGTYNVRTFPMSLDLMSVLGSERAYEIADEVYEQTNFDNYAEQTEKMRGKVAGYGEEDWTENVYAGWLHVLKLLVEVKGEGYPSFMLSEAWVDKTLNAALGSWAELRHDTILYAKQSVVAECGGEGGEQKPPPPPKGYVEPEVLTYWRLRLLTTQLRDGLQARKLLTDEGLIESFDELVSLLQFLEDVSVKQLTGQQLSAEEFKEIEYYGDTLSRLNLYSKRGAKGDEITSMTDKDMAVIADVHTGTIGGPHYALEEGVGHANEIYVVYPMEGKLLLGRGAVFDYYEFVVPIAERMTDEKWQEKLTSGSPPQPPKWTESFLSPYKGSGETIEFQEIPDFSAGGC